ncbi:hypothetical protein OG225_38835 [Nocardia sp. NBC_01377]|uniref:WXG100 family type VII secretion target n=1 Tax=Nocardia TaxID=1817 RepID=UPI001C235A35|nr:hypothetical protein [Nocardia noduli]
MLYDEAAITQLYDSLHTNYTKLVQEAENMNSAATNLNAAWEGSGLDGFNTAKGKWDTEYQEALTLLNKMATAVDNALVRAFQTDKTIGDGFGA